jgi:phosphatidylserine decarboxylase
MSLLYNYSTFIQYFIPQHALSRFAGVVARCQFAPIKNYLIKWFIKRYGVNMQEAANEDPANYPDFHSFFIRTLREGVRPIALASNTLASPVDGTISQIGAIQSGRIFQAKGFDFDLLELVGGKENTAKLFAEGQFATLYLAPKDYHRVHMPLAGKLVSMTHVPGQLFSVNPQTVSQVPNLFARNERVVCIFDTAAGPMAIILVGAMIVASIYTAWAGEVTPVGSKHIRTFSYPDNLTLTKGEEMGYFKLGSTVILLFGPQQIAWQDAHVAGDRVKMGETLGTIISL